ncbi:MAG TPA: hypothetical protein VF075_07365 [Pyrinomonadaceae bacterium]
MSQLQIRAAVGTIFGVRRQIRRPGSLIRAAALQASEDHYFLAFNNLQEPSLRGLAVALSPTGETIVNERRKL